MLKRMLLLGMMCLPATLHAQEAPPLRVAVPAVLASFDPAMALGNAGLSVTMNSFDTLIKRNYRSNEAYTGIEFVPGLATEWKMVDDRTMDLHLRPGVTFQDGSALTAEDVVFSFTRILAADSPYVAARTHLGNIESITAPDPGTVRVVTRTPDAALLHLLSYPGTSIVSKAYYDSVGFAGFGQRPLGTGPYRITDFVADQALTMTAHPGYWGGAPAASSVTFNIVPEVASRITALANGEVDIATSIPPDQAPAVDALGDASTVSVVVNSQILVYNTYQPFIDRDLRQAMNLAIDRELLAQALWMGSASVPVGHQYPEWGPLYDPARSGFAHDPERARALVESSAYDGEEILFHTHPAYYTNGLAAAEAIVEMWRAVGINARVHVNERWTAMKKEDPTYGLRNGSDWTMLSDPAATIGWTWTIAALWNGNDEFRALAAKARAELDVDARRALYGEMLDLFDREAPGTVLYRVHEIYGVSDRLEWRPYTNYVMDFRGDALAFRD